MKYLKKILYFHSTIWSDFFSDLLYNYQLAHNSKVAIICSHDAKYLYSKNFRENAVLLPVPDFSKNNFREKDKKEVEKIDKKISQAERAAGMTAGRLILAGERDIGYGFSQGFYHWTDPTLKRYCKINNLRPGKIIRRIFYFLEKIFNEFNPSIILTRSNNEPLHQSAWFLAKKYDIPYLTCRFSKFIDKHSFWTDDFLMHNRMGKERLEEKIIGNCRPCDRSLKYLKDFRNTPSAVDYIAKNWNEGQKWNWLKRHKNFLSLIKAQILYHLRGGTGASPKPVLSAVRHYYRTIFMERYHKRYFSMLTLQQLREIKYIYYPLHKEPELMLNFGAPLWHDQRHAIKYISSMLPYGFRLVVKEHRFNWGRRYTQYLKYISQLPNVILINPFENQFKYIRNADLIITDNGSAGWEGLLMKKPVITLTKTLYSSAALARRVENPEILGETMLEAIDNPLPCMEDEFDKKLALFLDAERETCMPIESMYANPDLSIGYINRLIQRKKIVTIENNGKLKPVVLGVIPARGGSKRLPGKNIKDLCGKPLLAYTIEAAQKASSLTDFVVSTENKEIMEVAKKFNAPTPFARPRALAGDNVRNIDTVFHAMQFMEELKGIKYDILILLQPTCPVRDPEHIDQAIELLTDSDLDSVVSVKGPFKKRDPILKAIRNGVLEDYCHVPDPKNTEPFYLYNAALYAVKRYYFVKHRKLISPKQIPLLMDQFHSIDIDTLEDFVIAEAIIKYLQMDRKD